MKILQFLAFSFKAQRAQGKTEATIEAKGHEEGSRPWVSKKYNFVPKIIFNMRHEDCTIFILMCVISYLEHFKKSQWGQNCFWVSNSTDFIRNLKIFQTFTWQNLKEISCKIKKLWNYRNDIKRLFPLYEKIINISWTKDFFLTF